MTVATFTLPFLGRVDPGSVQLFDPPGIGAIDLGQVLTVVGIVAVANVINLIDGVDGLAAGVCLISAAALAVIALSLDRNAAGVLAAVTAGASLGFLRHGFPPASSFMGDTGSNLLGYLMAVITVQGALKTNAVVALFFPLAVLAVPILDTSFVVAKRLKYRRPIYRADTEHFHHRMARIGFSQRRTITYLYGWTLVLALVALALRFVPYSDNHGQLRRLLDDLHGPLPGRRPRGEHLRDPRARDPQAPAGSLATARRAARARRLRPTRRRWTSPSSTSSTRAPSAPLIPRPGR